MEQTIQQHHASINEVSAGFQYLRQTQETPSTQDRRLIPKAFRLQRKPRQGAGPTTEWVENCCRPCRNSGNQATNDRRVKLNGGKEMKRFVIIGAVSGLVMLPALLMAQTAPAGRGNPGTTRRSFEKFT